jgi:hypothetical protein
MHHLVGRPDGKLLFRDHTRIWDVLQPYRPLQPAKGTAVLYFSRKQVKLSRFCS